MNKAFTLIELLVVIAIIGILASIVLVSLQGAKDQAELAEAQSFARQVRTSLGLSLVAEWRFENNTNDSSGYENNGTIVGDPAYVTGMFGQALEFNGNDYVDCGSGELVAQNTITIEAWIKPNTIHRGNIYVQNDNDNGYVTHQLQLNLAGNLSYDNWNPSGGALYSNTTLVANNWYHAVVTRDGDAVVFYLNGTVDGGGTGESRSSAGHIDNTLIGARYYSGAARYLFNGAIDEVRIYNQALSLVEIQQLYAQGAAEHGIVLK